MELKSPRAKTKHTHNFGPTYPIHIQSETGLYVEDCTPMMCTGTHRGLSVIISCSDEMATINNMGDFGKGLCSRSKPHVVRNSKQPQFVRQRQFDERQKWAESTESFSNADSSNSIVVLPDSDSDEDYFEDIKPRLRTHQSVEYLALTLEEAFFLSYGLGCLRITNESNNLMGLEELWKAFCESKDNFPIDYTVYHYFRAKGWVVKPGIKFGGNFLLYKKGQSYYHASYIVIVHWRNENDPNRNQVKDWVSMQNLIRLSATAAKEILLATVILPHDTTIDNMKSSPNVIKNVAVCETLMRRWTTGFKDN